MIKEERRKKERNKESMRYNFREAAKRFALPQKETFEKYLELKNIVKKHNMYAGKTKAIYFVWEKEEEELVKSKLTRGELEDIAINEVGLKYYENDWRKIHSKTDYGFIKIKDYKAEEIVELKRKQTNVLKPRKDVGYSESYDDRRMLNRVDDIQKARNKLVVLNLLQPEKKLKKTLNNKKE